MKEKTKQEKETKKNSSNNKDTNSSKNENINSNNNKINSSKNKNNENSSNSIENIVSLLEQQLLSKKQEDLIAGVVKEFKLCYNKLLNSVEPDKEFITKDNKKLRHMFDLFSALETMEDHVFRQHVNQFKNDFAKWIKDVFDHKELAYKAASAGTRKELKQCIAEELRKFL